MGYTANEIDDIQAFWGLRFPPDLVDLLRRERPLIGGQSAFDWIKDDPTTIRERLEWPFQSFWFDVEHNGAWWSAWGEKPEEPAAQYELLRVAFAAAPKLIPLYGHRYLPETPCDVGNPVFSVYQTDVIVYGADLADWIVRERDGWPTRPWPEVKDISFWSEAVRRNNEAP